MEQFLQVGVISSTHGIRGEVKVFPTTDDPNRFKKLKKVILETKKEKLSLEVQGVKFFKQFVIVKFKGIDNINDIEQYKGCSLFVSTSPCVFDSTRYTSFAPVSITSFNVPKSSSGFSSV